MRMCTSDPWSELAIGARPHFQRIYTGQPAMPRTPLYKEKSTQKVLDDWLVILKKYAKQYPETVAYDLTRTEKYGERGGYASWNERKGDLELYATRMKTINLDDPRLQ